MSLKADVTSCKLWASILMLEAPPVKSCEAYNSTSRTNLVPKKATTRVAKPHKVHRIAVRPRQPKR